jgi:hypothetical protein
MFNHDDFIGITTNIDDRLYLNSVNRDHLVIK